MTRVTQQRKTMYRIQLIRFLSGLFITLTLSAQGYGQSSTSQIQSGCDSNASRVQGTNDRELSSRANRSLDTLLPKLLEVQMQEIALQNSIDDLDYRLTPDGIQRALALVGSVRPMDELRDALRTKLEAEKARISKQLELLASIRARIEAAIRDADAEIERAYRD